MKEVHKKMVITGALITITVPLVTFMGRELYLKFFKRHFIQYRNSIFNIKKMITQMNTLENKAIIRLETSQGTTITSRNDNCENTMQIKLLKNLNKKINSKPKNNNPFLPPFENGIYITDLKKTHRLIFNKYMITKEHILIVSRIYEPQFFEITKEDLEKGYLLLKTLNGFCFFNSDKRAGASQRHKHLQVVPSKNFETFYLQEIKEIVLKSYKYNKKKNKTENDTEKIIIDGLEDLEFPIFEGFRYSFVKFKAFNPYKESIEDYSIYLKIIFDFCMKSLGNESNEFSFNLIFGDNWMLVVLRKRERIFGKISMNALGVLGNILVKNNELFDLVSVKNPSVIIEEILVKNDDTPELKIES